MVGVLFYEILSVVGLFVGRETSFIVVLKRRRTKISQAFRGKPPPRTKWNSTEDWIMALSLKD